jgi:hypothetical protein
MGANSPRLTSRRLPSPGPADWCHTRLTVPMGLPPAAWKRRYLIAARPPGTGGRAVHVVQRLPGKPPSGHELPHPLGSLLKLHGG